MGPAREERVYPRKLLSMDSLSSMLQGVVQSWKQPSSKVFKIEEIGLPKLKGSPSRLGSYLKNFNTWAGDDKTKGHAWGSQKSRANGEPT